MLLSIRLYVQLTKKQNQENEVLRYNTSLAKTMYYE